MNALFQSSHLVGEPPAGRFMVLDQFGVIDVSGTEAASFLHNQLTNDVEGLDGATARLAGYCSPKGRLLASLLYWRQEQAVRLMVASDLLEITRKRLSMFVLRAKAKLVDVSDQVALIGFAGDVTGALARIFDVLPDGVHGKVEGPSGVLIRLPDARDQARYLWAADAASVGTHLSELHATLKQEPSSVWDWLEIQAGEPRIVGATTERFVPQMVNFELLGAVNFKKGCYPGQEVVARSQYRGTVKRRALLAHADHAAPGDEVFDGADPSQPCGMIINAAPAPGGGFDCLVELKLASRNATVHVGLADGPTLHFLPLPYLLPEPATEPVPSVPGNHAPDLA
jgi:folate-binding protein YgfZ